jgi:hypothetical protein
MDRRDTRQVLSDTNMGVSPPACQLLKTDKFLYLQSVMYDAVITASTLESASAVMHAGLFREDYPPCLQFTTDVEDDASRRS